MTRVKSVEAFFIAIAREKPYLGSLNAGDRRGANGYFVRAANRTVYHDTDRTVLVRIESADGIVGWGETYGLAAPRAILALIDDLLAGFVVDRDPEDVEAIYDELYRLMHVRGSSGGLYHDAIAAIDIALWDLRGKARGQSIAQMLGGRVHERLPAYVSGLPHPTAQERAAAAQDWMERGFTRFKLALPSVPDLVAEYRSLRVALGTAPEIAADLHWAFSSEAFVRLAEELSPYSPWFLEAPCAPEDIAGLARACDGTSIPVAAGEEWRNSFDLALRLDQGAPDIVQPEIGHTGVTAFARMGAMAQEADRPIIPHATIGLGLFLTASLQASAAIAGVVAHEYQHSVLDLVTDHTSAPVRVESGQYSIPDGPGLGIEPSARALSNLRT